MGSVSLNWRKNRCNASRKYAFSHYLYLSFDLRGKDDLKKEEYYFLVLLVFALIQCKLINFIVGMYFFY